MNKKLQNKIFKLYSNCQLIEGIEQSIIYDIQRGKPYYIPNDFKSLLVDCKNKELESFIKNSVYKDYQKEIQENIDYLLENDLGFYLDKDELEFFPPLNLDYFPHKVIGNVIIDLVDTRTSFFDKTIQILTEIEHPNIEIWFDFSGNFEFLEHVLNKIKTNDFYSYNLHLNISNMNFYVLKIHNLVKSHFKIRNAYFYNTSYQLEDKLDNHFFIKKPFGFYKERSKISSTNFNINISLFAESQKHNTYFNRKLYIGQNGEIKNAPECEKEFKKIQDLKNVKELEQIIDTPEFQKYWYVHKEQIDVCKGCEFRHMCIDNRIPRERKKDEWFHQTECNYNPYIAKWQGEEGYKTIEECGVISHKNEPRINQKQLES